ncbi:hypothetical protein [Vitiosangium sp. GDMCC 1.1324]|uniref:hypothetical protein n=1 Tax=Vitiosangium sp. (strain GDMCC 1.1324) TaxID=2138576 RepID=UPI000D3D98E3|nr:hypothetical protein [Vitiosangium sp. GDMCC 1.1324]PTL84054.1 hypothetical protein DAT35_11420 [Vitiosangium sp. GDMCC 1.1324]
MLASFLSLRRVLRCLATSGAVLGLFVGCGASPESFVRLKLDAASGPCMEGMDCKGSDEVLADGTFRVDRFDEPDGGVHEVVLPSQEMENVRAAATRSSLLSVLRRGAFPCGQVTDSSSFLTLELEGEHYGSQLAGCDEQGVRELRDLLSRLRKTYVP